MASMGLSPFWNTRTIRHGSMIEEVLMIDCLSIVETDKVNHVVETDIVKLVVVKSFGMSSDKFDKETGLSGGLQPKHVNLSCIHALNELHFHEIHVVPNADVDSFKRCSTSYTFDDGYRVLRDLILHRSLINNSSSLSNKFMGFYFIFKFGISGLLQHVVTALAERIRDNELLEFMGVHDNDAFESSKPSWGKMCMLMLPEDCFSYIKVSESSQDRDVGLGEADSETSSKKESMKKAFQDMLHELGEFIPTHAYYNGSRTSKDN
ncbi:hypothetical protein Tco_0795246 [Tanacetum coccineum]